MHRSLLSLIPAGLAGLVLLLGDVALGYTSGREAGAEIQDNRSVPCGSLILFRCFGGATIRDFETELTSQGYTCVFVHGTEHSVYRCTGGAGDVDISSNGSLSSRVVAWSVYGAPVERSRTMFEIVAPSPFPRDPPHARRARSWIDANLDGRARQTTIGGYYYIVSAQPWSVLSITA